MVLRPVDDSGDILPVLSSSDLVSGAEAVALLVKDRLSLLQGEWWENSAVGFPVLEELRSSRLTEAGASALSSVITAYIRETPGVTEVEDVRFAVSGRQFSYSCMVLTGDGSAAVAYETGI